MRQPIHSACLTAFQEALVAAPSQHLLFEACSKLCRRRAILSHLGSIKTPARVCCARVQAFRSTLRAAEL